MKKQQTNVFALSSLTTALLAALGSAQAQEADQLAVLMTPQSQVQAGVVLVDRDNALSGQYTGLHEAGVYPDVGLSMLRRDDASGQWLRLSGRNLGLDTRELRLEQELQANWKYFVDYGQTPHRDPLVARSRLSGFGTTTQNATGLATAQNLEFETKREALALGFDKDLGGGFGVQVRFKNEEKQGNRMFGFYTGSDKRFLAEPIDFTTQQWGATLNYAQDRLQWSGGYYGSSYHNQNAALTARGSSAATPAPIAVALPPDNESHEFFLAGAYEFTPTTRGNFKAAYSRATQKDRFFPATMLTGNTRTDLDGELDTTIVQLGLASRPLSKLSLNASVRYEDRDDKTPVSQFVAPSASRNGLNVTHSPKALNGKLEAGYQLPMAFRLVGGVEYEERERSIPNLVTVRYRRETEELTGRVELRRALSETLGGSLSYAYSERSGSDFVVTGTNTITDHIDPIHWGDREREKWRLALDWTPLEPLSVQLVVEDARDKFPTGPLGRDRGQAQLYSLDANYVVSDAWQALAWFSQDGLRARQLQQASGTPPVNWAANLRTTGNALGLGLRGKPMGKVEVGAEFQHSYDRAEFRLEASTGSLPDIRYRRNQFKVYSAYAVQANAGVRVDLSHERWSTDDWTWNTTPVLFGDGTTVVPAPVQKVSFVGVSGYYRWW